MLDLCAGCPIKNRFIYTRLFRNFAFGFKMFLYISIVTYCLSCRCTNFRLSCEYSSYFSQMKKMLNYEPHSQRKAPLRKSSTTVER